MTGAVHTDDDEGPEGTGAAELPVLRGLARSRLSGKEIAAILGVSAPTVSKWRRGRAPIPAATVQFLTLLLASRVEALPAVGRPGAPPSLPDEAAALKDDLAAQEAINVLLPPRALRDGTRRFRDWWHTQGWVTSEAAE